MPLLKKSSNSIWRVWSGPWRVGAKDKKKKVGVNVAINIRADIVVHEMAHLLERNHGARFVALMDRYMPRWQFFRQKLNQIPVRHEDWAY